MFGDRFMASAEDLVEMLEGENPEYFTQDDMLPLDEEELSGTSDDLHADLHFE